MYVSFLSTYSDKKSCHTSTTLQTSSARFVSDSWAFCQNGGRHFGFWTFAVFVMWPLSACCSASWCKILLKSDNQLMSYGQKKRFSRWRLSPSWIFKISIFGYVTVIGFNICCSLLDFIKIGRFFTEIWFSDLQNGGRPPSWICCDVTILHRRIHFRCPNIVLKFHVDRCCSFRDTCSIISRPFGCR